MFDHSLWIFKFYKMCETDKDFLIEGCSLVGIGGIGKSPARKSPTGKSPTKSS